MKKNLLLCHALIIMVTVGCSSLPKQTETQSFTFARVKMKYGRQAQSLQQWEKALRLYEEAYDLFTRIDDIEGKIESSLSVARQYFYLDQPDAVQKWLDRASGLIENHMPRLVGAKAILLVEMAFEKEDYKKVLEIAGNLPVPQPEWQTEILCYAMVSKARLNLDYGEEFRRVYANLSHLQKQWKRGKMEDPEVLGLACYYLGYIYGREKNWTSASVYFEKARELDGAMDNAYGLGKDLTALGQCYEKLGALKKAAGCFRSAAEIFTLLNDTASAQKALEKAGALEALSKK